MDSWFFLHWRSKKNNELYHHMSIDLSIDLSIHLSICFSFPLCWEMAAASDIKVSTCKGFLVICCDFVFFLLGHCCVLYEVAVGIEWKCEPRVRHFPKPHFQPLGWAPGGNRGNNFPSYFKIIWLKKAPITCCVVPSKRLDGLVCTRANKGHHL